MRLLTVGLLAAALSLAACAESPSSSAPDFSGDGESAPEATASTPEAAPSTPPAQTAPPPQPCVPEPSEVGPQPEAVTFEGEPPAELTVEILEPGDDGATTPVPGDCVQVHYIGRLFDTGEVFDSSYPRGQTFGVEIGAGRVIPGFEQGLLQAPVGAVTRVTIPPELGYGPAGSPPVIPENATLVFDLEVVSIS